jgi:hypothetical protein
LKSACFLAFLILFNACEKPNSHRITPAFYYWKTKVEINDFEQKYLDSSQKIYVKFFDIDLVEKQLKTKATVIFKTIPKQAIVPTVFITNRSLIGRSATEIDTLAKHTALKINGLAIQNNIKFNEVQFDCDWSQQTQLRYFRFLKQSRTYFSKQLISATIRLHQVKFPSITGIPPVDRGMLMCYNMDDWKKVSTQNSIFNPKVLEKYADKIQEYPLPLDLAMPLFHWAILYRNDRFLGFFNQLDAEKLKSFRFVDSKNKSIFEVNKDTNALGFSLRKGDIFRAESIDFQTLEQGTKYVLGRIKNKDLTLSFYHLDSLTLQPFSHEQIHQISHQTP